LTIASEKIKELVLTSNCGSQKKSKQIVKELTLDCLLDGGFLNEILHFFEFFF